MSADAPRGDSLRVLIAGGGVAALETGLALRALAEDRVQIVMLAPEEDFVYRPLAVREPFAYGPASRLPLSVVAHDLDAELLCDRLAWVDPRNRVAHTQDGEALDYDVLMLALGARPTASFTHALPIDDRRLDELLHGLVQDVELGHVRRLAFVAPARMAWPMPIYELALMLSARAYDCSQQLERCVIVTPEDSPLAIFGLRATAAVSELLTDAGVETITSAYARVPDPRHVLIHPQDRAIEADRVIALPELYGPAVRGLPTGDHGFIAVDAHSRVRHVPRVYAAGDATEFPVKHGGLASQQADAAAESIAALAGAPVTPTPFRPVIHGMLLTGRRPRYLTARITGGQGFSSEISEIPSWTPAGKIAARYLAPYLAQHDLEPFGSAAAAH